MANTFTRGLVGFGLLWAPEDFITNETPVASNPNPFDDAYRWLWRRYNLFNYAAPSTVAGDGKNLYQYHRSLVCNVRSTQPSPKHRLWFAQALSTSGQGNITSIGTVFALNTGLVLY